MLGIYNVLRVNTPVQVSGCVTSETALCIRFITRAIVNRKL